MSLQTAFTQPIIAIYQNTAIYIGLATEAKKDVLFLLFFWKLHEVLLQNSKNVLICLLLRTDFTNSLIDLD